MVFYSRIQTTRRMGQSCRANDDKIWRKRTLQFSVPRVHCPEERSKAKEVENFRYTSVPMGIRLKLFFRTIISVNQLSIYGAVSDLCEEYKACHVRTGRPVLAIQSDPLFVPTSLLTKTPTPSTIDPAQEDLLRLYQERVERLSQQNRVIKICTDAGFLTTVGVGQENFRYTSALMGIRLKLFFRTIISLNHLSIYGAVSDLCEEYKACHVRTGRPVLAIQSDPLFVPTSLLTKTPTPSTNDPAQEDLLR